MTASYNQGRFIEETIRSVLLQGYPDLEYMIIDGGSTDGSLEVIRKYEPWLAYWVSEPDRGQAHAINKGWKRATGDIIAYINTDDYYVGGAIATAARQFCVDSNAAMVYGTAMIVDESGRELQPWQAQPFDFKRMLLAGSIVPQPATFFSKVAVASLGYLNEERQMILDYELCVRIGLRFSTACITSTLARMREHPQSKTRLRFETTARELVDFITTFPTYHVPPSDWKRIRNGTLSRVYYESAVEYFVRRQAGSKVLKQLIKSIRFCPRFVLGRRTDTIHILKQVLGGYGKWTKGASRTQGGG